MSVRGALEALFPPRHKHTNSARLWLRDPPHRPPSERAESSLLGVYHPNSDSEADSSTSLRGVGVSLWMVFSLLPVTRVMRVRPVLRPAGPHG